MSEVGKRVRGLRKALGLTQEQLSRRAGVSQPTISHIERGHTADLTGANLSALCVVLRTNADFLLHGKGSPSPPLQAELEERELIDLFRQMSPDHQQALLTFVRSMNSSGGAPNETNPFPAAKRAEAR
jgi:transcriptional regulator with XRE-family HTH domain